MCADINRLRGPLDSQVTRICVIHVNIHIKIHIKIHMCIYILTCCRGVSEKKSANLNYLRELLDLQMTCRDVINVYMYMFLLTGLYIYIYIHMYVCIYILVYIFIHMWTYVCLYLYIYINICLYIYTHI